VKPFSEIQAGDCAVLERTVSAETIEAFAAVSGDRNPLHIDDDFARNTVFAKPVAHGMLLGAYVSTLVGMHLPGPGALWTQQSFRWLQPVFVGDTVRVMLRVTHKSVGSRTLQVQVEALNQNGVKIMEGEGLVLMVEQRAARTTPAGGPNVALVTGASRGIGSAVAQALAENGASVAVGYRERAELAEELCQHLVQSHGRALPVQLDVTDPESVSRSLGRAASEFGTAVNILVNNAGEPAMPKPFAETSWDDLQAMMDVTVRGAFHCSQAVLPQMVEAQNGAIVNIGSIFTEDAPPAQWTAFVVAKSALKALTRSLAVEYGPKGIRVNMVSPGMTATDSTAHVPDRLKKVQAMQTPLRRLFGRPKRKGPRELDQLDPPGPS
jgi:3-oxoacyl-[acyl-carrier protein] reductase